jgi:hypothetical protein
MSVVAMLAILWWGLCGFLAVLLGLLGFLDAIGKNGRIVFFVLLALLGHWLLLRHFDAERRAAEEFLDAWQAASNNWPNGRMESREIHEFLDLERINVKNPNFPQHFRLLSRSPVRAAGKEKIRTNRDPSMVQTEVYLADARMHSSEGDVDYSAKIRVWVATDSHRVVKFMFEDIVFM